MGKVAVVTDSSANIPGELVERYRIHVIPLLLHWEKRTFRDGVDITPSQLYKQLRESKELPTTSAPSVGDFLRVYAEISRWAEGIVSIHLPPKLSVVYEAALTASKMVEEVEVKVIDCGTAAIGQGFVVLEAAKAAAKGASLSEVVRRAEDLIPKVNLFATLDTLEYLHRGGRVPAIAALLTSALKIKPIIYLKDGEVGLLEKPRTKARAIKRMIEIMGERVGSRKVHVAVFHTDALKEAEGLKSEIEVRFNCEEIFVTEFTPVMGAHTGPGLLGLAFWAED
jgi:DegV family protein with EDD domain